MTVFGVDPDDDFDNDDDLFGDDGDDEDFFEDDGDDEDEEE